MNYASVLFMVLLVVYASDVVKSNTEKKETFESLKSELDDLKDRLNNLEKWKNPYPKVKYRSLNDRKRILITGGAGFVGSHLVDRLIIDGHRVIVADNFFTGSKSNIEHWIGHPNFELINHDVVNPLYLEVDQIYHLASPASPQHYMYNPIKTIKSNTIGTINMLGLARRVKARFLFASTSEIYGDPETHPQNENYWGNVNPIGPRACYDESKRLAESLCYAYEKLERVEVRVARIFNTYGPRMNLNDGRVVSNFILQSLRNESITIYGDGDQTRSFQYVDDLVNGLVLLMNGTYSQPVNLGNTGEYRISELATIVRQMVGNNNEIVKKPKVEDDPQRRRPDITVAMRELNWQPVTKLSDGLKKTIEYFRDELERNKNLHESISNMNDLYYLPSSSVKVEL